MVKNDQVPNLGKFDHFFSMFFKNSYVGKVQVPNLVKIVQVWNLDLDANLDLLFAT